MTHVFNDLTVEPNTFDILTHNMRKRFCIFLICWLPCFVMAANVMALQMQLSQSMPPTLPPQTLQMDMQATMAEMPCHHAAHAEHQPETSSDNDVQPHHCAVCGYCVISSGVATLSFVPGTFVAQSLMAVPRFLSLPVHSQTYPPAIRPPIFS